ncbi:MAG: murein biosynthesis integral membrane protein MurJ [Bdellovibrionales bacterium]
MGRRKAHEDDLSQKPQENSSESRKNSVVFRALTMSAGTFSSRLLGLVREMLFAALFDRTMTDAFMAAFKLPNLFRRLLGEGSLAVSFQPLYVDAQVHDPLRAKKLRDSMHLFLVVVLSLLTVLGFLFAREFLGLILDADYVARVEAFEATVRMAKIMFGFLFFICLFAYYMALLNAHGAFGWAAVAPVFFNISLIISTLLPPEILPVRGDTLALGVLVGGFLQMFVLIRPLRELGYFPSLSGDFRNPDLLRVLRNMLPGFLGLGLMQITMLVNMAFASALGEGAISYINWADRLLELPLSLISVSLGTALLPTLAEQWARGERGRMVQTSERTLSLNFYVAAMAAVGLCALSEPIVRLLFERGRFTSEDSRAVKAVIEVYALTMIPVSGVRVLAPAFYAAKNTWYPAVISGVGLLAHILLAPMFMKQGGLVGLNLSSFISAMINFGLLVLGFQLLLEKFLWKTFFAKTLKTAAAAAVMTLAMLGVSRALGELLEHPGPLLWASQILLAGTFGVIIYLGISFQLKHDESHVFLNRVLLKLKLKRG